MSNAIPVNIPGGKESIFDGAGTIKDMVSQEAVENAEKNLQDYEVDDKPEMKAVDAREFMKAMRTKPVLRDYKKIGRNDPCPCGAVDENGKPKKYKNCCLASGKYETVHQLGD